MELSAPLGVAVVRGYPLVREEADNAPKKADPVLIDQVQITRDGTDAIIDHADANLPGAAGVISFFPRKSFSPATSSIDSAKSFFSRRFSSSSALSFCASDACNPPYLAFQR